jgi:hypothetical protein
MRLLHKFLASIVLIIVLGTGLFAVFSRPQPAAADIPVPTWCIPGMPCSFQGLAGNIVDDITSRISGWIASGTVNVLGYFWNKLDQASDVRLTLRNADFFHAYERQMGIALLLLVPLVLAATFQFMLYSDLSGMIRLYVVSVPVAVIGGFIAVFFVDSVMLFMDKLAFAMSPGFQENLKEVIQTISTASLLLAPVGLLVFVVGAAIMIFAVIALSIELIARDVMIITTLIFVPLAFAGSVWPVTSPWLKRSARLVLSLGFVKFVMIALLTVGIMVLHGELTTAPVPDHIPWNPIAAVELDGACRNETITMRGGQTNTGQQSCVKNQIVQHWNLGNNVDLGGLSKQDVTDQLLHACRSELQGLTETQANALPLAQKNAIKTAYYQCFENDTGLATTIPALQKAASSVVDDNVGFTSISKIIAGTALFILAALSPAIAFKLFDIFDAGVEQVRYARRGSTLNPGSISTRVTTGVNIADLVTRNKASRFLNE